MDFTLHLWQPEYTRSIAAYANNKKIADNLRNGFPHPYTEQDAKQYIAACIEKEGKGQVARAIIVHGEAVGSIGIFFKDDVYCKSAELGYWLGEPFWRNGIISSAIVQLCRYAFENYDLRRIFAEPFGANTGSRKALEKAGFILEGVLTNSIYKNNTLQDSCMYALVK